jgi:hypothetical protein
MPADETSPIGTGTSDAPSASSGVEETGAGRLVTSAALIGAGMLIEPELLGGALLGAGVMYGTVFRCSGGFCTRSRAQRYRLDTLR